MNAERLMLIGGVSAFLLTVYWVRSAGSANVCIGWLLVATLLLVCGILPDIIMRARRWRT